MAMDDAGKAVRPTVATLAREGEYWTVSHGGRIVRIRHSKGMGHLAELLASPHREQDALAMAAGRPSGRPGSAELEDAGLVVARDTDVGPALDETAKRAYRRRLEDLQDEIDDADANHDLERAASARLEHDAIVQELRDATGLGGRDRRAGSPAERARLNVTRAVRTAIQRIAEHDDRLAAHLGRFVRTGRVCVYSPDPSASIEWQVNTGAAPVAESAAPSHPFETPTTRYARNAGVSIAYQVVGDGPRDLLFVCGTMSHVELWWTDPFASAALRRLAEANRVILFDKPGTGLSDPIPAAPTLEQRTADLLAVLDAVGSERAVVLGYSEGGLPSMVLAASHPERVEALVLLATLVSVDWAPDIDVPKEAFDHLWAVLDEASDRWGEGVLASVMAPSWAENRAFRALLASAETTCMSPAMARSILQGYHGYDAREAAASIHVPTLVLHGTGDLLIPPAFGHDLAARIEGAKFVPLHGADHIVFIKNSEALCEAIEEFLAAQSDHVDDDDRVLAAIVCCWIDPARPAAAPEGFDGRVAELMDRFGGERLAADRGQTLARFARPARAVRFAVTVLDEARRHGAGVRAGVHVGECGVSGTRTRGDAVEIAVQVTDLASNGEVLVTSTVADVVVASGLEFTSAGSHRLPGASRSWQLHRYERDAPGPLVSSGYETDARPERGGDP
jgi:pimeloyl-ACP methyl ester carboxylesterase